MNLLLRRPPFSSVLAGAFLVGCAAGPTVHLEVQREPAVTAGPYHRTLVVSLSGDRKTKNIVESAFQESLRKTQTDPGRGLVLLDSGQGDPRDAAKLGYDSVLVVDRHPIVHWAEPHAATLADAFLPHEATPFFQSIVPAEDARDKRHVNGCARLYDAVTARLVWTCHGTIAAYKDDWTTGPTRAAAKAVVKRLTEDGFLQRLPL